jgi:5-methylcytosine-specific restriction enzyme subunit McrC
MGLVFQDFLQNFYRIEQTEYRVTSDQLVWAIASGVGHGHELLPRMETDVLLRSKQQTMVIECKWYRAPLVLSHGQPKIRSDHLYQLFAYLKNVAANGGVDAGAMGILLYPEIGQAIDVMCQLGAHEVRVRSLDLMQSWAAIRTQLLSMLPHDQL